MNQIELTLLEQMRITELEVEHRKELLGFTYTDVDYLLRFRTAVRSSIDAMVREFYEKQTAIDDIALVIGDSDTLRSLEIAQKRYVLELFHGVYDIEYVNSRLRIGLMLKRIGIDPKLYLAATNTLKCILFRLMDEVCLDVAVRMKTQQALDKLFYFDMTLVFEMYVRSMVTEIELGKDKLMHYAKALEQRVALRTAELEMLSRVDPLTGLLNRRILAETMQREIRIAERNGKPLCLVYFDLDRFKEINDTFGHDRGDEVLKSVGEALREVSRNFDLCFRLGGDEFCVVLTDSTEDEAYQGYCDRLMRLVAERVDGLTLSIGVAQTGPEEYDYPDELIKRADNAMYEAKRRNKAAITKQAA